MVDRAELVQVQQFGQLVGVDTAQDAQQFGGTAPQHIRGETLFGARPPFLKDFLNDEVSASATRPLTGKVLRIAASEFNIQL